MWRLLLLFVPLTAPDAPNNDEEYVVQIGTLDDEKGHLTLIINDSDVFHIHDAIERLQNLTETSSLAPFPPLPSPPPISSSSSIPLQSTSRPSRFHKLSECRKLSDSEKYHLLEELGALNQQVMANNAHEAGLRFASSLPRTPRGPFHDAAVGSAKEACDERCQTIRSAIETVSVFGPQRDDAAGSTTKAPDYARCVLNKFQSFGNCTPAGEADPIFPDHVSLCTECQGVFLLNNGCFPSILNSVQCDTQDGCIYDTNSKAHGKCVQKILEVTVLRNFGTASCEDWRAVSLSMPSACQCLLSENTYLSAEPN